MKYMAQIVVSMFELSDNSGLDKQKEIQNILVDMLEYGIGDLSDKDVKFEVSQNFNDEIVIRAFAVNKI